MKYLKKVAKIGLYLCIGLLVAGFILPFVFKDKIIQYIQNTINSSANADITFSDADLSFFASFPDVQLTIDSLKIIGNEPFENVVLYDAPKTHLDIDIMSLFSKEMYPQINNIHLESPSIHVVVMSDSLANYQITEQDTSSASSSYHLNVKKYSITNANVKYDDYVSKIFVQVENLNHQGKGDFTQDVFDLKTTSTADALSITMDDIAYIKNAKANFDAGININFPEEKYTLLDNVLSINDLDLVGDGYVQFVGADDLKIDMNYRMEGESFKSLLSIIPNAYTQDFKDVTANGTASIAAKINGIYNETSLPSFDVKAQVSKGYVKYPSLPNDMKDINAQVHIFANEKQYRDMTVDIPTFSLKVGEDPVSGRLYVSNATSDQKIEGNLDAKMQLSSISQAFPMENIKQLAGLIDGHLSFKAKMSDVEAANYSAITFDGNGQVKDMVVQMEDKPKITIPNLTFNAQPQQLSFQGDDMKLGQSDFDVGFKMENPLAVFSTKIDSKIDLTMDSEYFNADEWVDQSSVETDNEAVASPSSINPNDFAESEVRMQANFNKIQYDNQSIDNLKLKGKLAANSMDIEDFRGKIGDSDFSITGYMTNAMDYLFASGILTGELNLKSQFLDLNPFMQSETSSTTQEPMQVIPVPERMNLKLNGDIDKLQYTNYTLNKFSGSMNVHDSQLDLSDVSSQMLGGKVALSGTYNTKDIQNPDYAVKLDLKNLQFKDAYREIVTFKQLAPLAEYIEGIFNTTLVMSGKLGSDMTPDLNSLDASGLIETLKGSLKGFLPMSEIAAKLNLPLIKEIKLDNTKNWFEIVQGFVEMKDYHTSFSGIDLNINGKHGLGKDMDYNLDFVIPRKLMEGNAVTSTANTGLNLLQKEASKLGISIIDGNNIFVNVKITGNIKNPTIKITPKLSQGVSNQDIVNATVAQAEQKIKDSLSQVIKKQEEKLKDTVKTVLNNEVEKAKKKAEEAANKAIDSVKNVVKQKVISQLDTMTSGIVSDSLKQKAKDILEKQSTEEINKIKDKLEDFNPFKKKKKSN